ncbi:MAG: LAETG motif-containing sortase-dependent surface protein [Candidatus Nanopelagicales bacterium]
MIRTTRRLLAGALAAGALLAAAAVPAGAAGTADAYPGLFGSSDPTYDGVFRQSISVLAYVAAGDEPPAAAVEWLLWQQCDDGGFEAFRADTSKACTASDPVGFTGEDTNSTGLAAAALLAVGELNAAEAALGWLEDAQNADGGFPYFVGGDSDANSTAVVLLGTSSAGLSPQQVAHPGGATAADFLLSLQLGCAAAPADEDGAFSYNATWGAGYANDAATVQAALALSGAPLPFVADAPSTSVPREACASSPSPTAVPSSPAPATTAPSQPASTAEASPATGEPAAVPTPSATEPAAPAATTSEPAATEATTGGALQPMRAAKAVPQAVGGSATDFAGGYIARLIDTYGGAVPQLDFSTGQRKPGTVSAGDTAWAVLALSAIGVGGDQRDAALQTVLAEAGKDDGNPGILGLAVLGVVASDGSRATVDGLIAALGATLQEGAATGSPAPTSTEPQSGGATQDALSPTGVTSATPWIAGLGVILLGGGAAALVAARRQDLWA